MKRSITATVLLIVCAVLPPPAHSNLPRISDWAAAYAVYHAPEIAARSALLLDAETGSVLYEKDADLVIPPASLTKVVAMHVAFRLAERGELDLNESVALPPETWAANLPPGSSLMFLAPGQQVTVLDLLVGLAVPSGNDAAIALALHVSGSVPDFAALMTREARAIGLPTLFFEEPSGLSAENRVTAREFAHFVHRYLALWPEATSSYHALPQFTWPPDASRAAGTGANAATPGPITQFNRNSLLESYPGVDGIKTGYIRQSRYNLAATAVRDGRRLIAVLLGVPGENHLEGERNRARDASLLFDYGFERFRNVELQIPAAQPVRVWMGREREVGLTPGQPRRLTVAVRDAERLSGELVQRFEAEAPVARGQQLGEVAIHAGKLLLVEIPLRAEREVARGGFLRVAWDSLVRFILRLFGG